MPPTPTRTLPKDFELRTANGATLAVPVEPRPSAGDLLTRYVDLRVRRDDDERADAAAASEDNTLDVLGSVETKDSYDTVFIQKGMDATRFEANPVILWNHDAYSPPLGRATEWKTTTTKVRTPGQRGRVEVPATLFSIEFDVAATPGEDDEWQSFTRGVMSRYRRGFLRGASIRFRALETMWGDGMTQADRDKYGISEWGAVFLRWELVELSLVTLPSNADALSMRNERDAPEKFGAAGDRVASLEAEVAELRRLVQSAEPKSTETGNAAAGAAAEPPADGGSPGGRSETQAVAPAASPDLLDAFAAGLRSVTPKP